MSARILYSLSDNKSGGGESRKQHIGCMNGIFQLFDRSHFLSGGCRPADSICKRLETGKDGNCVEENIMSIKSTGEVWKAAANERDRLSTDSSRSSPSTSSNSSSFSSSFEDNRLAKIEPRMEKRAKDLSRLQRLNNSGANPAQRSGVMMYVDSPRPVLPSGGDGERKSAGSVSLRDSLSFQRPRNFVDSPRFSYDGRESGDVIKSNVMKFREQPRHSLDSKKISLSSSSLRDQQQQEEPGRAKWRSSVVAKLMGLEAAYDAHSSSKPQMGHGRSNSVNALDPPSVSSRTTNEYLLHSPSLSVYDELDKRLEQIEFKRSGKDPRALKQKLEAMDKSTRLEDGKKNVHRVFTETSNIVRCGFMDKFKSLPVIMKADVGFCREQIPHPRGGTAGLPQNNSSDQRALPMRSSSRYARYANRSSEATHVTDDRPQILKGYCMGRNLGHSRAQLQSPRRSSQPVRQQAPSPCRRTPKSKVSHDLTIGNSRKPIEPRNKLSIQSDDDASLASRDDESEVSSYHLTLDEQTPKKVLLLPREVDDNSPHKCGIIQAEQPSPISVFDLTYLDNESLSTMKMTSEDFEDVESMKFCRRDRDLKTAAEIISDKKHSHTYILQTHSSTGLLGNPDAGNLMTAQPHSSGGVTTNLFPTLEPNKPSKNLVMGQSQSNRGERIQRKLLFDVIDEIMVQRLVSDNKKDLFSPYSPAAMKTGQELLLQELCSEISQLRADIYKQDIDDDNNDYIKAILRWDMHRESQTWKERFDNSSIVLDIERLIFKDLVTEAVTRKVVGLRNGLASYFPPTMFV